MKAEMKWKGETRKAEIQNGGRQRYHGFSRRFVARQRGRGLIHYVATALTLEGGFSSVAHTKTRLFCSVPRSGKQWYCYGQQQQQCRPPTTEDTTIASKRKVRFIVYIYIYYRFAKSYNWTNPVFHYRAWRVKRKGKKSIAPRVKPNPTLSIVAMYRAARISSLISPSPSVSSCATNSVLFLRVNRKLRVIYRLEAKKKGIVGRVERAEA